MKRSHSILAMGIVLGCCGWTWAQDYAWAPLGSGTGGSSPTVLALTVFSNELGSELIAGGAFTTAGSTPADYIASWNGSTWQPVGSGMNGAVWALTTDAGELVAGGSFTTAGGNPANYIAHWDGSTWQPFGSGLGGASPVVFALTTFRGELIAGGNFTGAGVC